jgi:predicted aspartyl protease
VLALLFASGASAQTCGLKLVASYDMVPARNGRSVLVKMRIAGTDQIMQINTGAWHSYLTSDAANALNLPQHSMGSQVVSYDGTGRRTSEVARASSIEIGPVQLEAVDFMVMPKSETLDDGVAGFLGSEVLKLFDVDLDFGKKKVNFFSQDHCPGQVVYWSTSGATKIPFKFDGSTITLPIELDGNEMEAVLATGASVSTISMPVALQVYGLKPGSEGVDAQEYSDADGHKWTGYTHTFAALKFGGLTVPLATLHLMANTIGRAISADHAKQDYGGQPFLLPPVMLGLAELSQLHLYISYKEKMLYVTAADQH